MRRYDISLKFYPNTGYRLKDSILRILQAKRTDIVYSSEFQRAAEQIVRLFWVGPTHNTRPLVIEGVPDR